MILVIPRARYFQVWSMSSRSGPLGIVVPVAPRTAVAVVVPLGAMLKSARVGSRRWYLEWSAGVRGWVGKTGAVWTRCRQQMRSR